MNNPRPTSVTIISIAIIVVNSLCLLWAIGIPLVEFVSGNIGQASYLLLGGLTLIFGSVNLGG